MAQPQNTQVCLCSAFKGDQDSTFGYFKNHTDISIFFLIQMLINKNLWRFLPAFLKEELHRHHHSQHFSIQTASTQGFAYVWHWSSDTCFNISMPVLNLSPGLSNGTKKSLLVQHLCVTAAPGMSCNNTAPLSTVVFVLTHRQPAEQFCRPDSTAGSGDGIPTSQRAWTKGTR